MLNFIKTIDKLIYSFSKESKKIYMGVIVHISNGVVKIKGDDGNTYFYFNIESEKPMNIHDLAIGMLVSFNILHKRSEVTNIQVSKNRYVNIDGEIDYLNIKNINAGNKEIGGAKFNLDNKEYKLSFSADKISNPIKSDLMQVQENQPCQIVLKRDGDQYQILSIYIK